MCERRAAFGFATGIAAGALIGLMFGLMTVMRGADQVVTGIVLNIFALALAAYLSAAVRPRAAALE